MTDSALPAHLEVLLTDEPVLDLYAHGPWRVPDGLSDQIQDHAQQLNRDPRATRLATELPGYFSEHTTAAGAELDLPRVVTEPAEDVMTGQYL